ncbi:gamma-glutamyl-gamma-aminobutyrate hydrolase family protein [Acidovorax sp. PRC11]|uniref:gamma-glutamyl-gamma-aminobutyrate hydrolase family protein n=1 Tax=Acidovorax sp. PRC11 TaxID=2962592 RepID=UPI0028819A70|nr:gamma-glutamyl-gamma-aminobutyrate hydrolase family protein [Acidovorax sp. PRC11]MDT0140337.1 gamma-glutamyl-gamma-aminobutyrate hydrolase family protein [Acidovorax sp. PRC11]
MSDLRPLVGVSCCLRGIAFGDYPPTPHHTVFHKYVDYVLDELQAVPVLIPATPSLGGPTGALSLLAERLDGVLFTGSPSNVGLRRRDDELVEIEPVGQPDRARDETTHWLIRHCLSQGVPMLGICRGMQEMNVACGGELHEQVHELGCFEDHRSDKSLPYQERYKARHSIRIHRGSYLSDLIERSGSMGLELKVNSLHSQAVSDLGDGVSVQATSEDGVTEAIVLTRAREFALGVQWHIEWGASACDLDKVISSAFRAACVRRARRTGRKAVP